MDNDESEISALRKKLGEVNQKVLDLENEVAALKVRLLEPQKEALEVVDKYFSEHSPL